MTPEDCRTYARFNAWANARIFDAAAQLSEGDYRRTRSAAFFGSLRGTLNHLLLADRLWIGRALGEDPGFQALDQILYDDFAELRSARVAEDARMIDYVQQLSEADLEGTVAFRSLAGDSYALPLGRILSNLFNHQTHHRGQAHALIKEAGAGAAGFGHAVFLGRDGKLTIRPAAAAGTSG